MQVAAPPAPSRAAAHTDDAAALTEAAADDARTWLEGFRAARRQAAEYVESEGVEEEAEGENEADDRAAAVAAAAALLQVGQSM